MNLRCLLLLCLTLGLRPGAVHAEPVKVGDRLADAELRQPDGTATRLAEVVNGRPTLLVFYRGSWCPYCTRHLEELHKRRDELQALGVQLVAVSPDAPETIRTLLEANPPGYPVLSDNTMAAATALGLAFTVDADTLVKYREYGIDLEKASGQTHHQLPHPAAILVDENGIVRWAHWDANYKRRVSGREVVRQAERLAETRILRHIVLLTLPADQTPGAAMREIEQAIQDYTRNMEGVAQFEWGRDVSGGARTQGFTHALLVTFKTPEALAAYGPHPDHQRLVEILTPRVQNVLVLDYYPTPGTPGNR